MNYLKRFGVQLTPASGLGIFFPCQSIGPVLIIRSLRSNKKFQSWCYPSSKNTENKIVRTWKLHKPNQTPDHLQACKTVVGSPAWFQQLSQHNTNSRNMCVPCVQHRNDLSSSIWRILSEPSFKLCLVKVASSGFLN